MLCFGNCAPEELSVPLDIGAVIDVFFELSTSEPESGSNIYIQNENQTDR